MKKKIWVPLLVVVLVLVIGTSQYPKLYIATGYGAKCMASGIFVAGREPEQVKANDLNYSIVKYTTNLIDYNEKSVTTSLFGMAKQKAVYREGLGCCLVDKADPADGTPAVKLSATQTSLTWKMPWPDGDAPSDTIFPEIDSTAMKSAVAAAFDKPGEMIQRTAAVLVAYKGKLVAERYWTEQGITPDTRLWGWSMNKSIVNALVGILVKQGKLSTDAAAPVEEWLKDKRQDITINNLLQMSSGLKWNEDYGDVSEATTMLYRERNCYRSAIVVPLDQKPGTEWKYSSGTANILSGIVRNVLRNEQLYYLFPYRELFDKLGMTSMALEADAGGYYVGSSYGYATARDWAKFGQLYLQDGVWKGDSILPRGWVAYTRRPAEAAKGKYGALFWLNRAKDLPDLPEDMFSCNGHRGQRVFILPSRQLVVVRLGFSEDKVDYNRFLKSILAAVQPSK